MPCKPTKPYARYYIHCIAIGIDGITSNRNEWQIKDNMVTTREGESLSIAICRNIYIARKIRDAMNDHENAEIAKTRSTS